MKPKHPKKPQKKAAETRPVNAASKSKASAAAQSTAASESTPKRPSASVKWGFAASGAGPRTEGQRLLLAVPGSLAVLARAIGCDKSLVSYWRSGKRMPEATFRAKLHDAYGIVPDAWGRVAAVDDAPSPVAPALTPAPPPEPAPRRTGTLGEVEDELDAIRLQRSTAVGPILASESARLSDSATKLLALKARLERDRELLEDRVVREHPMWRRIREAMLAALKPFPDAARAVAKALEGVGA